MPEPWSGTDLLTFVAIMISSACFLYWGLCWIEESKRDKRIKALQKHWRERNEERRRLKQAEEDAHRDWERSDLE